MNSPLGKYAAVTAAIASIGIISAWVIAEFIVMLSQAGVFGQNPLSSPAGLKEVALIAIGAIFGSAVAVNGYRAPLAAAHSRIDKIEEALPEVHTHEG